ncbi:DMT family transporter [Bacillus sp. FJAT-42376]|uniref:DMT family transporter n=1 Tax=Bacillus sp. FJAT-42376 TaxID=2014076 RepID=UPI000F505096|nr:DMT family transporter [Bacillus sp. FJAT-42376]AZB44121.1 DMT family transporter [Bacillus sp. FJAT-42376]
MNKQKSYAYFALLIGVLSVSASAVLVKMTSTPAPVTAFYRMFFSAILMLPFFFIAKGAGIKRMSRKDWLYLTLAGVFLAFHFILWFESLALTSVASSVVLVTLQPLFAFIGTFLFFGERVTRQAVWSAGLAIVGSLIISWGDFQISGWALAGDFLALTACFMVTAYLLFGQEVRKRHSLILQTTLVYAISAITLLLYCLLFSYNLNPGSGENLIWLLMLAVFPNLLGHSLFNWALRWISTNTISVAILFEPVGAILLAYYVLEEKIMLTQAAGSAVIFAGVLLFIAGDIKKESALSKKMDDSGKNSGIENTNTMERNRGNRIVQDKEGS